jgi:hypothetical protein
VGGGESVYAITVAPSLEQPPEGSPPPNLSPLIQILLNFSIPIIIGTIAIIMACYAGRHLLKNKTKNNAAL